MYFREWKLAYLIQNSLKFVAKGPIIDKPEFVQVIAWIYQLISHQMNQYCPRTTTPYSLK